MKTKKTSTAALISWLDQNLLALLAGFLLVFIPLYPKLPLVDIIPGYIVRLRLEDLFIAGTAVIWLIQVMRKKVDWKNPLTNLVIAYAIIGLLSSISAVFITKTVPLEPLHAGKMLLHYFRYLEYFTLLFIFYSAVRSSTHARNLIILLSLVMLGVTVYGYGQKYYYWPVYSTMNREFAKGWRLYLTEHARVPSTFGGHYDLAAFTMVILTILLSLFFTTRKKPLKWLFGIVFLGGLWLLILTASRTSFIAFLVAITVLMGAFLVLKGWKWALPRWVGAMFLSLLIMLSFGDLSERFSQVLGLDKIRDRYRDLAFLPKTEKPDNYLPIDEISLVTTPSDTPPVPIKPGTEPEGVSSPTPAPELPPDVFEDIPLPVRDEKTGELIPSQRTYSNAAYRYGLSASIRFDALWPRAWAGFLKNPLLGSGYATLTRESIGQFTEAESTDNNFLRTLGETGLLGFISFYSVIVMAMYSAVKNLKKLRKNPLLFGFAFGMVGATIGLLVNAVYIDVFAASKVAETYWALVGILLAITYGAKVKSSRAASKSK